MGNVTRGNIHCFISVNLIALDTVIKISSDHFLPLQLAVADMLISEAVI